MISLRNKTSKLFQGNRLKALAAILFMICALSFSGCGGGGGNPPPITTGTISGTVSPPANTNAKLFDVPQPFYARLFASPAHAAAITDLTTLTVKIGSATTNPNAQGAYTLTVEAGTNLDLTVTAPSGNVILMAIVSVTAGGSTSQTVDSTSTAIALIYKQNTSLTISQISSSSAVTNVKTAIETALTNPDNAVSITSNSTVTTAASSAAITVAGSGSTVPSAPTGVSASAGDGQATVSWSSVTGATSYNLYMAEQSSVTKSNYSSKTGGMAHTGVTSPYAHTGLTNGTTYYFVVTAVNSAGESSESSEVSAAPAGSSGGGTKTVKQVSAGSGHTCAVLSSGGVKCWGANWHGELGIGTNSGPENCGSDTLSSSCSTTPVSVSGISNATNVSVGNGHTCALTSSGGVKCWGYNYSGQLGNGSTTSSTMPVDVSGLTNGVTKISTGNEHTCALTSSGGVKCWGDNFYGQLGNGTTTDSSTPVDVTGLTNGVTAVSIIWNHTCALTSSGSVKCWGANYSGQLGNGASSGPQTCGSYDYYACATTPVDVLSLSSVTAISAGGMHTCALTSFGSVKCWGQNFVGQLGNGATTDSYTPVSVSGISTAIGISDTCALLSDGTVNCWGNNDFGQLGIGTYKGPENCGNYGACSTIPVSVSGISTAIGISGTCALLSDGTVKCWGANNNGELGNGTNKGPEICDSNFYDACSTTPVSVDSSLYARSPLQQMKNIFLAFVDRATHVFGGDDVWN